MLYICNGGGSYAKEVYGKKGFLSALDATSGKLLWRSAPLTCNATFAIAGEHIISGYGFTAEPDFVFLVRRSDGAIVQKVPIDSGPETITLDGNRARVEMYGHVADFELAEIQRSEWRAPQPRAPSFVVDAPEGTPGTSYFRTTSTLRVAVTSVISLTGSRRCRVP